MPAPRILISAREASGDLYAARLVEVLGGRLPGVEFFGSAGERMRRAGVRQVVDAAAQSVVGLFEVLAHVPAIYGEYRKLVAAARREQPDLAILTDSPDFHLPLARRLKAIGVPVVYLVAPQAWAWRKRRVRLLRERTAHLLSIFPFEEEFFGARGVRTTYIGHPLSRLVRPQCADRAEFLRKHGLPADQPLLTLLPGSRAGEATRHLGPLIDCAARLHRERACSFLLALPAGLGERFREPIRGSSIQLVEGETWDAIAHADLALAASGTVTVEAALLGTPLVTFYKVSGLSWRMGRFLVKVPHYSMVNLVAGRRVIPELMQNEMSGENLAAEARRLLEDSEARSRMREELARVAASLSGTEDPMEKAATVVEELLVEGNSDAS